MSTNHIEQLEKLGAILSGHFQLTSGLHTDTYVEKFRLLQQPSLTEKMCGEIAKKFAHSLSSKFEEYRGRGITSLYGISKELNTERIPTAKGTTWYPTTVKNTLAYL